MKLLHLLLILALCGLAFANTVETQDAAAPEESSAVQGDRQGRAMGDDDDFSADFDELIRYFQRGIMRFINKMTGLQERQIFADTIPATLNQIQRGIKRFINRMMSPEERQGGFGIPFIGRFIFRSLSYLGSFLVGALAVPPLLAGNALSLFGLYRPGEPNELISSPVLPTFGFAQHTDRNSPASSQQVNDLSEALFLLGQKNQHSQQDTNRAEELLAQAAGSSNPVEISEIVNDLIRVQSNARPASFWDRLTSGLSVFLPQVSRQVTPAGALGSLFLLGTLIGAPYFLNRRSDLFAGDFEDSSDETPLELPNHFRPPHHGNGQSAYERPHRANRRNDNANNAGINGPVASASESEAAYEAYQQGPAYSADQAYAAANVAESGVPQQYSPYQYVNRRSGEAKNEKSEQPAAPAQAA